MKSKRKHIKQGKKERQWVGERKKLTARTDLWTKDKYQNTKKTHKHEYKWK